MKHEVKEMIKLALSMLLGFAALGFVCNIIGVDVLLAIAVLQQTGGMNSIPTLALKGD